MRRLLMMLLLLRLLLLLRPQLLGRRRGRRRHVATQLAGGGQGRGALGTRMAMAMAGLGIVADVGGAVGRVGNAALVGIGRAGDAMRGWRRRRDGNCVRGRRRGGRGRRQGKVLSSVAVMAMVLAVAGVVMEVRIVVLVLVVVVESWRPSWIHSAEVLAA